MIEQTPPTPDAPPFQRLLRREDVLFKLGVTKSTLHRWIADGHFPRPTPISARSRRWPEAVVDDWIAAHLPSPPTVN